MNQSFGQNQEAPTSNTQRTIDESRQGGRGPQMVPVKLPQHTPYVTYTLIVITSILFLLQLASRAMMVDNDILINLGGRYDPAIQAGQLWRFLTPALLHVDITHILFNMYALYSLGTGLERSFGHGRFLLLYGLGAFTGNVFSFLFSDAIVSVGASTAVFGLLGAEAVFLFLNRKLFAGHYGRAIQNVIFIAVVNLILGLQPGIDNWGHVGGLLGGLIFTWVAGPVWKMEGIPPMVHLEDQRSTRDVIVGAATVILVFGALAMWGMAR